MTSVELEHVKFLKAALVEQQVNALARRKLAFGMLFLYGFFASA
jgi:hypothetical protein